MFYAKLLGGKLWLLFLFMLYDDDPEEGKFVQYTFLSGLHLIYIIF